MFANTFYAGDSDMGRPSAPGKHEPMVSLDDFERVQALLGRPGRPRSQHHEFAFTGMLKCGECGLSITAERKLNRTDALHLLPMHQAADGTCDAANRICPRRIWKAVPGISGNPSPP